MQFIPANPLRQIDFRHWRFQRHFSYSTPNQSLTKLTVDIMGRNPPTSTIQWMRIHAESQQRKYGQVLCNRSIKSRMRVYDTVPFNTGRGYALLSRPNDEFAFDRFQMHHTSVAP